MCLVIISTIIIRLCKHAYNYVLTEFKYPYNEICAAIIRFICVMIFWFFFGSAIMFILDVIALFLEFYARLYFKFFKVNFFIGLRLIHEILLIWYDAISTISMWIIDFLWPYLYPVRWLIYNIWYSFECQFIIKEILWFIKYIDDNIVEPIVMYLNIKSEPIRNYIYCSRFGRFIVKKMLAFVVWLYYNKKE